MAPKPKEKGEGEAGAPIEVIKEWTEADEEPAEPEAPVLVKPKGVNHPLKISSLVKIWNNFVMYGNKYALAGSFSQTHKRFRLKTNGMQGGCNCVVANAMSFIWRVDYWDYHVLNQILSVGDNLYEKSLAKMEVKPIGPLKLTQICPTFFLGKSMVTFQIVNPNEPKTIVSTIHQDQTGTLTSTLLEILEFHRSCILEIDQKHLAVWKYVNAFFLFDPTEHKKDGERWDGFPSKGFAICLRFPKLRNLAQYIVNDNAKGKTLRAKLWPFEVLRCQMMNLRAPRNLEEIKKANEEEEMAKETAKTFQMKEAKRKAIQKDKTKKGDEDASHEKSLEKLAEAEETSPEAHTKKSLMALKKFVEKTKVPVEPHLKQSITYFTVLDENKMGILRASTHQMDKKFSRFRDGEQSLSQAVAALVMRRNGPARHWIKKIVNDILKLGETIHHKSLKTKIDGPMKLSNIVERIVHPPGDYTLNYEELGLLGKLESEKDDVLDLLPALMTFLRTYDCCIINGPAILAVWYEDDKYYMYDPNERDDRGRIVDKNVYGFTPGVACVTWFSSLKDLTRLYMENIPREMRRNDFHLSKVIVEDYEGKPEKWNNFQSIAKRKWILRGTLSQGSHVFPTESRNTQCTANAAMSVAFLKIKDINKWSKNTIDQILMSGDEYYRVTVERLRENQSFVSKMLMVDELNRNFSFSTKEIIFDIKDCCVNGILGYPDHGDVLNVKTGLMKFFDEYDHGILTCRNLSVAVWKKDDAYYYFDSHSLDEKGVTTCYGTACVTRVLTIDDLAKAIETNLKPDKVSFFNISSIDANLLEAEEKAGVVRLPLNNFKTKGENLDIAILPAKSSCKNTKFEFNAGKQMAPMCVAAMGINRLRPSHQWNSDTLEVILDLGNKYFERCMAEYECGTDEIEEDKGITSKNLAKQFKIGVNDVEIEMEVLAEGFVDDSLAQTITDFYTTNDKVQSQDNLELLVECENINVAIWKDQNNLFYVFDPYPRDANGEAIGKDAWTVVPPPEEQPNEESPEKPREEIGAGDRKEGEEEKKADEEEEIKRPKSRGEGVFEEDKPDPVDEDAQGKACVLFFYNLEDVVKHVLENTRPTRRSMMPVTITRMNIKNTPKVKEIYDKDLGERKDIYSGNWYSFVELDHGHWILRGQIDLHNEMFPEDNRGKQEYPCIISALAFAKLYAMSKMETKHITSILGYGDRMMTYIKRLRKQALAKDKTLNLLEDEIRTIIKNDHYDLDAYPKSFVIGDFKVTLTITKNYLNGETTAKNNPDVLDVKRALDKLFLSAQYGIIESKGYTVGVWKGNTVYYMFDPHKTSVNGVRSPIGYPCITRYLKTDLLADIFLQSIPVDGLNSFTVHKVAVSEEKYQRSKDVMEQPLKITGFIDIAPGKSILRGSFSQDDPRFKKGENSLNAPVAYIALTMSLIHKPETWSKPIVDEVITVADELFNQTVKEGGTFFNQWEDEMDPYVVAKDFNVGVMKANLQIRKNDQTGILDIRDPIVKNLRQGLERFFLENTQGIIYSPPNLCLAVWEVEKESHPILYMYDPKRRDSKGLPSPNGVACVITFGSAKMMSDHILACLNDPEERHRNFTILPVEITVGPYKTNGKNKTKAEKKKCVEKPSDLKKQAHLHTVMERRGLKKRALLQRKKLEDKIKYWEGRTDYVSVPKKHAIVRGTRCLTSSCYQEKTRGLQDIPVCVVAFVAHHIVPVTDWTWKEIDAVLDTGDQLYRDSYIAYGPRNKMLGLENVIRDIYIMNNRAHVTIYKPIAILGFNAKQLASNLDKWFLDQTFCMLNYMDQWVAIFFKKGFYYLFDPHQRGPMGCRTTEEDAAACVLRFENLEDLALKLVNNLLPRHSEPEEDYELVLVRMEGGVCQC